MFARPIWVMILAAAVLSMCAVAVADGFLLPVERPNSTILVPNELFTVKYHYVNVDINDQLATTKVDQIFHNDASVDREGIYVFPMPEGSAITKFSMYAGENEIVGKVMDKTEARSIYESIVMQRKDPALLEYIDRNTFRASVYPVPAHGDKRIKLHYSEVVKKSGNAFRYVYPLSTERFSAKPLENCKVTIRISSKHAITNVYSPTHIVQVERPSDNEAVVTWQAKDTKPDTDMIIYYSVSQSDVGIDLLTHKESGEQGFYMLLASPRVQIDEAKVQPKNIVFVLDRTGSMAGDKIDQAKGALKFCLNSLKSEDHFNVITFNETPELVFSNLHTATKENVKKAVDFVDRIDASGGTNINAALAKALAQFDSSGSSRNYVVFLTDGLPTVGVTDIPAILKSVQGHDTHSVKIFSFGVGYDVNTHFLDKLAEQCKGDTDYVRPQENIETKVSTFFAKVSEPLLSDVALSISGVKVSDRFPTNDLPDIFKGTQLIAFGRYEGSGPVKVELTGTSNGTKRHFTLQATLPNQEASNEFIPQLWATRKIGYLLNEIRLHSNQELIDEVVKLSKEYGIPTEYTSMLADDRNASTNENYSRRAVSSAMSSGNAYDTGAYGVAQSSNTRDMKNQAQLPAATASVAYDAAMAANPASPAVTGQFAANGRAGYAYRDAGDRMVVIANVQNIARQTFYQRGNFWEASNVKPNQKFVQVKQFSEAHLRLLKAYPRLAQFSTLGNIRLTLENNQAIEIGPDGKDKLTDAEIGEILKGVAR